MREQKCRRSSSTRQRLGQQLQQGRKHAAEVSDRWSAYVNKNRVLDRALTKYFFEGTKFIKSIRKDLN